MGNGGSSSSSKGTLTSAFLTSQHGASFVSSLLSSDKNTQTLPDGTVLTPANVSGLYQRYVDATAQTKARDARKARDICFNFLLANLNEVLSSTEGRRSFFELSLKALKKLVKNDNVAVGEFSLYVVIGVWADRLVTLEKGDEWDLPAVSDEGEEEPEVDVPDWKLDEDYANRLRDRMAPLLPHVRFPLMSPKHLDAIAQEGRLVPAHYIAEAYRHKALAGLEDAADLYRPDVKANPRLRNRRFRTGAVWDPTWHGQNVTVSSDGKTVQKTQSYWYCLAMAKDGYSSGRHVWAVQVGGDEAYIGVARKELSQLDNYLGADVNSWAYTQSATKNSGASGSAAFGETFGRGDVIGVVLDMTELRLTFYKNGKKMGDAFTNLPKVMLYPAVGWRDGTMTFVDPNFSEDGWSL